MRSLLPVLLVVLAAVLLSIAAAVGVVLWMVEPGEETTTVLVYEVDPDRTAQPGRVDLDELTEAIVRRLNSGWNQRALVRRTGGGSIEATVLSRDARAIQQVQRLLARVGRLEFHRLANAAEHPELIEQAKREKGSEVHSRSGELLGRWVPVASGADLSTSPYVDLPEVTGTTTRIVRNGTRQIEEVLVVHDDLDVGEDCVEKFAAGTTDEGRQPCVDFEWSQEGARRFAGLFSAAGAGGPWMEIGQVAIMLDGRVVSTPFLRTMQYDRRRITGSFSRQEVNDLVEILSSGPLPAAIRQVDQREGAADN